MEAKISMKQQHTFWIINNSISMKEDGKMQALNNAIRETIPHIKEVFDDVKFYEPVFNVIKYSDVATWHLENIPLSKFQWEDISVGTKSISNVGTALNFISNQLEIPPMPERALCPFLILITDSDSNDNIESGIEQILSKPWGRKAIKIFVPIGNFLDKENFKNYSVGVSHINASRLHEISKLYQWLGLTSNVSQNKFEEINSILVSKELDTPSTFNKTNENNIW